MTYQEIIKCVSVIYQNDEINKEGLVIEYKLNENDFFNIHEYLYLNKNEEDIFTPTNILELEVGGILVRLVK